MKKSYSAMMGVTLLEIMLVLAVASMVIVMSIRYYQSANSSQSVNSVMSQIQSIVAAADGLTQASGTYANIKTSDISPLLPNNGLNTPWGGKIAVAGTSPTSYTITIDTIPTDVCPLIAAKIVANAHFTAAACPPAGGSLVITYTSTLTTSTS